MKINLIKIDQCPVCHSGKLKTKIISKDFETGTGEYHIDECESCHIMYTNPQPLPEEIGKLYETRLTPDFPEPPALVTALRKIKVKRTIEDLIRRYSLNNFQALDFGCGDAFVTWIMSGYAECKEIIAVDFHSSSPPLIAKCDESKVRYENLFSFNSSSDQEQFDVIFCRHVLEHVHNPIEFLHSIKNRMKPGGILFIELPNIDTIWLRIFGKYFSALYLPRHLFHFTSSTLPVVVNKSGLKTLEVKKTHLPLMGDSIRYATGLRLSNLGIPGIILFPLQVLADKFSGKSTTLTLIAVKPS